jgi:hypothetical protein
MEYMGMLVFTLCSVLLIFGSLNRVEPELFALRGRVLLCWNNTILQIFDRQH